MRAPSISHRSLKGGVGVVVLEPSPILEQEPFSDVGFSVDPLGNHPMPGILPRFGVLDIKWEGNGVFPVVPGERVAMMKCHAHLP